MSNDPRVSKKLYVQAVTSQTTFENFESLLLIDAGGTDGFQLAGSDDNFAFVPTGVPVSIGAAGTRVCEKATVKAASGKSLNVTAIIYR